MGLNPVAFDIETSGLDKNSVITVAGFWHEMKSVMILNTDGRGGDVDIDVGDSYSIPIEIDVVESERDLLLSVVDFVETTMNGNKHYLTAYNGETWNGGFDLPFCRTRFAKHDISWPFADLAYCDMMGATDRFRTDDGDLVSVYDELIGNATCDPFDDSGAAVDCWESGDWKPLVLHNLADIKRTHELAELAGRYVPKSDFSMKSLEPPSV